MVHEMMVALTVTDGAKYQAYREAMAPILADYGGGFRYDFDIARVLKSASDHAINRVDELTPWIVADQLRANA